MVAGLLPRIILMNFLFHGANSVASSLLLKDDYESLGSQHEAQIAINWNGK